MTEFNFDNANYYFKSKPRKSNLDALGKTEQFSLGKQVESDRFIPEHDIYHFLVDAGLLHLLYKQRTNQDFRPEVVSSSFHGEALIELLGRFFGNFKPELRTVQINNQTQKCLVLPQEQKGLRPGKGREGRVFLFNNVTCLNLNTQEKELQSSIDFEAEVDKFIEFIILASLLNGDIAEKYLIHLQQAGIYYPQGVKHFVQIEFRQQIRNLLKTGQMSEELAKLDIFLRQKYGTSINTTINYCKEVVNFVQECFLNPNFDTVYTQGKDLLIPLDSNSSNEVLTLFHYINKSANLIHDGEFESIWQLNTPDSATAKAYEKITQSTNNYQKEELKSDYCEQLAEGLVTYYAFCLIEKILL